MATNAITLDGGTQWGTVSNFTDIDALTDGTLTAELWFNQASSGSDAYAGLFNLGDAATYEGARITTENAESSTGINFAWTYSGTDADGYKGSGLWTNGNWVHVAAVYTLDNKTKIYINGSEISYDLQQTPSGTAVSADGKGVRVGSLWSLSGYEFKGDVGGFLRVWSDVRTQTEIDDNKSLGLQASGEDNLIINCKFSEGSGAFTENEASPGDDMDFTGSPSWTTGPTITEKSYGAVKDIIQPGIIPFPR